MVRRIVNRIFPKCPPVVRSVAEWAHQRRAEKSTLIRPALKVAIAPPIAVGEGGSVLSMEESEHLPERYLVEIKGAVIRGKDGYVVLPDGAYCLENTSEKWLIGNPAYFQRLQPTPTFLPGDFYSLMSMHCREYYHWLHDVLTSVFGVLGLLPPETRFLVPAGISAERVETLAAVGISEKSLVFYDSEQPVKLERLHFAPPAAPHCFDDPSAIRWLRERLRSYYGLNPELRRRLYVARIGTATRRIANEEEISSVLKETGFELVRPEDFSLREQALLFSQAEMIVGPHGAGLTNMLFSAGRCRILDITAGEMGFRTYYWSLASACEMPYYHLQGKPVVDAYDPEEFVVDAGQLRIILNRMIRDCSPGYRE